MKPKPRNRPCGAAGGRATSKPGSGVSGGYLHTCNADGQRGALHCAFAKRQPEWMRGPKSTGCITLAMTLAYLWSRTVRRQR